MFFFNIYLALLVLCHARSPVDLDICIWCSTRAISVSVNFYSEVNAAALGGQLRISYTREFCPFLSSLNFVRAYRPHIMQSMKKWSINEQLNALNWRVIFLIQNRQINLSPKIY